MSDPHKSSFVGAFFRFLAILVLGGLALMAFGSGLCFMIAAPAGDSMSIIFGMFLLGLTFFLGFMTHLLWPRKHDDEVVASEVGEPPQHLITRPHEHDDGNAR